LDPSEQDGRACFTNDPARELAPREAFEAEETAERAFGQYREGLREEVEAASHQVVEMEEADVKTTPKMLAEAVALRAETGVNLVEAQTSVAKARAMLAEARVGMVNVQQPTATLTSTSSWA
jgi:hypothetical protein